MAAEIESLKNYSLTELEEILEKRSKGLPVDMDSYTTTVIEVDGAIYEIPEAVNELLNSIYRMYRKEAKKNKSVK